MVYENARFMRGPCFIEHLWIFNLLTMKQWFLSKMRFNKTERLTKCSVRPAFQHWSVFRPNPNKNSAFYKCSSIPERTNYTDLQLCIFRSTKKKTLTNGYCQKGNSSPWKSHLYNIFMLKMLACPF